MKLPFQQGSLYDIDMSDRSAFETLDVDILNIIVSLVSMIDRQSHNKTCGAY